MAPRRALLRHLRSVSPLPFAAWTALAMVLISGPAAAGELSTASAASPELKYGWEVGMVYLCQFTLQATVGDEKPTLRGAVAYVPMNLDPKSMGSEEGEGAGSAFVISADGLLVTCAHVVRGAVDVQVYLGGKKYPGKVVAYEPEKDLAVVKIAAQGLPVLSLAGSGDVALGQEVRAVGFPLSDVLGESVKITRGTIAGIVQKRDRRHFQIDAAINPGNSGGPLVDEQSRVVGVANAMLDGQSIERVGFAIPAEDVTALLKQQQFAWIAAQKGAVLSGPQLAQRVTPSVALVKVRTGPGGVGTAAQRLVSYSAGFNLDNSHSPLERLEWPSGRNQEAGVMRIDTRGHVDSQRGSLQLPLLIMPVARVGLERLPGDDREAWSFSRAVVLFESEEVRSGPPGFPGPRSLPPSSRYRMPGRPWLPGEAPQVKIRMRPAMEETRYTLADAADGTVTIRKEYELSTIQAKGEPVLLEIKGNGTIVWDKKAAMPTRSEFQAKISSADKNTSTHVPVLLSCVFSKKAAPPPGSTSAAVAREDSSREKRDPVRKIPPSSSAPARTPPPAPSSGGLNLFDPDK